MILEPNEVVTLGYSNSSTPVVLNLFYGENGLNLSIKDGDLPSQVIKTDVRLGWLQIFVNKCKLFEPILFPVNEQIAFYRVKKIYIKISDTGLHVTLSQ